MAKDPGQLAEQLLMEEPEDAKLHNKLNQGNTPVHFLPCSHPISMRQPPSSDLESFDLGSDHPSGLIAFESLGVGKVNAWSASSCSGGG